ncbi:VOC family protein [Gluconacetobacter azotocaptans]|uniref:VOC family protein n=1 Tax=Gluconacetobacter azotocaptans TaxID=142834 RepID=A0A7W4PCB8_9PROT|nr:VOC family protein [Gluconacetobacter azotocaptans]MBB2188548.1 VOC family protein [Gluconacetobacter azotocaptans]MBM9400253.1 VOC family protein [Gluconacetobacter azotocaptans]GBQ28118.1 glyoxalase [Gluconacetobacter azotocaptans DSM 13594]
MRISAYVYAFDGRCREAFAFYQAALGGEITAMMTFADTPMADSVPLDQRDRICHAALTVDGQVVMGSDGMPDKAVTPAGFSISVTADTAGDAGRIFTALSNGGSITMPLQQTFWAPQFGMLVDKFGVAWMVGCDPAP